jgi:hypothetical protein
MNDFRLHGRRDLGLQAMLRLHWKQNHLQSDSQAEEAGMTFWTTIWGLVGAFPSVPITASVVILCRNIQPLRWIAILFSADGIPEASDEPVEPMLKISWPFNKTAAESEEFKALKAELEVMKDDKAKAAKSRVAGTKKPAKRRATITKTRKTQK